MAKKTNKPAKLLGDGKAFAAALGRLLAQQRNAAGLSMQAAAERAGISKTYWFQLEHGSGGSVSLVVAHDALAALTDKPVTLLAIAIDSAKKGRG